ncbi:MAG: ATP-binding protein, partial [candidate division KSB1 bacterium]|nr:ATP-binding protein [candidate division KSB1 bacterium]
QQLLDTISGQGDVLEAMILDSLGQALIHSRTPQVEQLQADTLSKKALAATQPGWQYLRTRQGSRALAVWVPIVVLSSSFEKLQKQGVAIVTFPLDSVYHRVSQMRNFIVIIGIVVMSLGILMASRLSATITRPLANLLQGVKRISGGDLSYQIPVKKTGRGNSLDEVGELGQAFNAMSSSLNQMIAEKIATENLVMLGEFATFVIHHLKSPLHGIRLITEVLQQECETQAPPTLRQTFQLYTAVIIGLVQRLETFVKETLDVTKPIRLEFQEIDLHQFLDQVLQEYIAMAPTIERDYDPHIPLLQLDTEKFKMALANLIVNAIEATPKSGKLILRTSNTNGLKIEVTDTGKGIPPENLSSIFQPFYTTKGRGNGLGLTIVKKIVEAHGGQISVRSTVGQGTTFTIRLPDSVIARKNLSR